MATAKKISVLVSADDLQASVHFWSRLLGDPTLVDADRWAQFDVGQSRLAIGAGSEGPGVTTVMVKVADLNVARRRLEDSGVTVGAVEAGGHELRLLVIGPGGERVVIFQPREPG